MTVNLNSQFQHSLMSTVIALKSCVDHFTRRYCNAPVNLLSAFTVLTTFSAFSSQYLLSAPVFFCTNQFHFGYWGRDLSGRCLYVVACIVQCCCYSCLRNVSIDLSESSGLENYISSFIVLKITSKEIVFIHESTITKQKFISKLRSAYKADEVS